MFDHPRREATNLPHGAAEPFWTQERQDLRPPAPAPEHTAQPASGQVQLRIPSIFVANDVATPVTYH